MRESKVETYLVERVEAEGGLVRKLKWVGRLGAPDRLVLFPGEVLFVEVKAPGEKPRASQVREHARLRSFGAKVYTLDTYEQVDNFINQRKNRG